MAKRDNVFTIKIDYEDIPITKQKVKGTKGLKGIFDDLNKKFGGDEE